MINFCLKSIWTFLFSLTIFMGIVFAVVYKLDQQYPFKPTQHLAFAHIEISVERPLEIEFERPSPTIFGPDFV